MIRYRALSSFTKYTRDGEPFTTYREDPLVPRIDDRFLDCSLYLYRTEEMARLGVSAGGSGFLAAVSGFGSGWVLNGTCPREDFYHTYAVTNRHVAKKNPVVRLNKVKNSSAGSKVSVIPLACSDWTFSDEHDIAIASIDFVQGNRYLFIDAESFLTEKLAASRDIGIGDEVFMVGRFINHEGTQQNNPSLRFGNISMMPTNMGDIDDPKIQDHCFCVETHTIPGYSGSPVFVRPSSGKKVVANHEQALNTAVPDLVQMWTSPLVTGGPWLLGIECRFIHYYDPLDKDKKVKLNTGMSCVIPAWHILDQLNSERLQAQRAIEQEAFLQRLANEGTTMTFTD